MSDWNFDISQAPGPKPVRRETKRPDGSPRGGGGFGMNEIEKGISELCDLVSELRDALATKDAEIARLREALEQGVNLIDGPLVGSDWKRECRSFLSIARAALETPSNPAGGMPVEEK